MSFFWMSFVDPDEDKWLGGCLVAAERAEDAMEASWVLRINPGGQVALQGPMPSDLWDLVPVEYRYRLLNREEVDKLDAAIAASQGKVDGDIPVQDVPDGSEGHEGG